MFLSVLLLLIDQLMTAGQGHCRRRSLHGSKILVFTPAMLSIIISEPASARKSRFAKICDKLAEIAKVGGPFLHAPPLIKRFDQQIGAAECFCWLRSLKLGDAAEAQPGDVDLCLNSEILAVAKRRRSDIRKLMT